MALIIQHTELIEINRSCGVSSKDKVRNYVLDNFLFTDDQSQLKDDDSFMDKGIVDSTGMLEIIYFIEDEFAVKVEDEEMVPENLDSVDNIVSFVERKKTQ
jgi:acyl carrier protein